MPRKTRLTRHLFSVNDGAYSPANPISHARQSQGRAVTEDEQNEIGYCDPSLPRGPRDAAWGIQERNLGCRQEGICLPTRARRSESNPSIEAIKKIANGLGVHVSDILYEESGVDPPMQRIPTRLRTFLDDATAKGTPLQDEDVKMLLGHCHGGTPPTDKKIGPCCYDFIKRIVG